MHLAYAAIGFGEHHTEALVPCLPVHPLVRVQVEDKMMLP